MDDTRFFTMNEFWQSIALTVLIGGTLVAGITYGVLRFGEPTQTQATLATTTPAAAALPAAAGAADPFSGLNITGQAAIVVDLTDGRTLYSQNADTALPLASLTKLITLYAAQQALSPTTPVTISSSSLAVDGDYGLSVGETFAYKDLARFALVGSSNDAAEAIAEAAETAQGQSEEQFMAGAVARAGLSRTRAQNGSGLDIDLTHASSFGSARDVAKLAGGFLAAAPDLAKATTKPSVTVYSAAGAAHTLPNTNPYAGSVPGMLLSKTGFTDLAGGNLAIVFDAGIGHPVAVVVLGSTREARFTDVSQLVRATLASFGAHPAP